MDFDQVFKPMPHIQMTIESFCDQEEFGANLRGPLLEKSLIRVRCLMALMTSEW